MDHKSYLDELFGLTGRRAVVTGASSGLGAAMAATLAKASATVLAVARRADRLEVLAGEAEDWAGSIIPAAIDLLEEDATERLAATVRDRLDGCDILVNCAGHNRVAPAEAMEAEKLEEVLALNLKAVVSLSAALHPLLKISPAGRIINIASVYGLGGPVRPGLTAYAASKHAIIGVTRVQAVEWAEQAITANAIAPGYFPTELNDALLKDPEVAARLKGFTPMGRYGQADELATALLFLASPASSFVTGAVIPVDGGWTAW